MRNSKSLIGIAGAHFVAAELCQRGIIATVTSRNTEGIDILASNQQGSKSVSIQVKTSGPELRKSYSRSWILNNKAEKNFSDNLFYVFVDLKLGNEKPDCYVVPSKEVANYVTKSHSEWLKTPGRNGKKHNDNNMRLFEIDDKQIPLYLNRWDNLTL
jgi:hypothetical protein